MISENTTRRPQLPKFSWPGEDHNKRFHNEVAAPAILLRELGIPITISPADNAALNAWIKTKQSDISGLLSADAGSWNHAHMIIAARHAMLGDGGDFQKLLELQSGSMFWESDIRDTPKQVFGPAYYLEGEEPRSNDYNAMRTAVYAYFAKRGSTSIIRSLARRVLCRIMGLELLGAVPWTDLTEFHSAHGQWYSGPTLSPVGQRSNKTSNPDQLGAFCRLILGRADLVARAREGWECAVIDRVGFERAPLVSSAGVGSGPARIFSSPYEIWRNQSTIAIELLGNARTICPFHFVMYPEGLLVWTPKQTNPNTPSSLWSFADHRTQIMTRGFPFNPDIKGRGKGAARSIGCEIVNGEIIARSTDEAFTARLVLPKSAPLWAVDIDLDGTRRVK